MVKSQLKFDRKTHVAIIEALHVYKFENGQYPSDLSKLGLGKKSPSRRATYEPYPNNFRYRIDTAWRIHAGHCIFDSRLNKWDCDDYPVPGP